MVQVSKNSRLVLAALRAPFAETSKERRGLARPLALVATLLAATLAGDERIILLSAGAGGPPDGSQRPARSSSGAARWGSPARVRAAGRGAMRGFEHLLGLRHLHLRGSGAPLADAAAEGASLDVHRRRSSISAGLRNGALYPCGLEVEPRACARTATAALVACLRGGGDNGGAAGAEDPDGLVPEHSRQPAPWSRLSPSSLIPGRRGTARQRLTLEEEAVEELYRGADERAEEEEGEQDQEEQEAEEEIRRLGAQGNAAYHEAMEAARRNDREAARRSHARAVIMAEEGERIAALMAERRWQRQRRRHILRGNGRINKWLRGDYKQDPWNREARRRLELVLKGKAANWSSPPESLFPRRLRPAWARREEEEEEEEEEPQLPSSSDDPYPYCGVARRWSAGGDVCEEEDGAEGGWLEAGRELGRELGDWYVATPHDVADTWALSLEQVLLLCCYCVGLALNAPPQLSRRRSSRQRCTGRRSAATY